MSKWNHSICNACWERTRPGRVPARMMIGRRVETCCYCGTPTASGIYVREDPSKTDHCNHKEVS